MKRMARILLAASAVALASGALLVLNFGPATAPGVVAAAATAPGAGAVPLDLRIWYPDQSAGGGKLPLIVISHGTGGSAEGHRDTAVALARAGFIVVAPTHTGDNYRDLGAVGKGTQLIDRPDHISRTIDYMLTSWPRHADVDAGRIGMFGFSAGGFTALVIAGAQPELWRGADYCRTHAQAWSCRYIKRQGLSLEDLGERKNVVWTHDPRVRAIVIAAPAIGYSFARETLAKVNIPVQLWSAERDDIVDDSPAMIRAAMTTKPEFHGVANAGHFSFMSPCNPTLRGIIAVMQWFGTEKICSDPADFDRERFHAVFNRDVTAFFKRRLGN